MIREWTGYLVLADAIAAVAFAIVVRIVGRRSNRPVPMSSTIFLVLALTIPAILLYGVVWFVTSIAGDVE